MTILLLKGMRSGTIFFFKPQATITTREALNMAVCRVAPRTCARAKFI